MFREELINKIAEEALQEELMEQLRNEALNQFVMEKLAEEELLEDPLVKAAEAFYSLPKEDQLALLEDIILSKEAQLPLDIFGGAYGAGLEAAGAGIPEVGLRKTKRLMKLREAFLRAHGIYPEKGIPLGLKLKTYLKGTTRLQKLLGAALAGASLGVGGALGASSLKGRNQ